MAEPTSTSRAGWEWRKRSHPRGREATVILAAPVWELETLAHQSRDTKGAGAQEARRDQLLFLCPFPSLTSNLDC